MVEKHATGGLVRFGDGPVFQFERSCWTDRPAWIDRPALSPPPNGMTLTMNFEAGFDVDLTPAMAGMIRSLTAGAPVDPRVDEEWETWRCPGCGRSHAEVKAGHAWQVDGAGNASCNGLVRP